MHYTALLTLIIDDIQSVEERYSAIESVGKSVTILLPPDQGDEESGILERIRNGLHIEHSETVRLRKDGSKVWVSLSVSSLRDARGVVIGASKIIRDMSERRRADEHRDILVSELNHRAKNSLAMVRAIASQTLATATSLARTQGLRLTPDRKSPGDGT